MQRVAHPVTTTTTSKSSAAAYDEWPVEIRALFQALSRPTQFAERRNGKRVDYRIQARLWIHPPRGPRGARGARGATVIELPVYLRDYLDKCISFVSEVPVRQDQKLELELLLSDGTSRRLPCEAVRCRQFRECWFEGLLRVAR
jgi:hypothetical protein